MKDLIQRRVSVVVPVFEVAAYLSQCVESVLAQSHGDLEVVLVDDGSTDGSGDQCDAFAEADPRVRVIHQENAGLSAARNAGLASSTANLVTFLDADDWWEPTFVESLVGALDQHPSASVAMSTFARVPGRAFTAHVDRTTLLSRAEVVDLFAGPYHTLATMACAKLFRRAALEDVRFPPGRLHEDEFTTYRALLRGPAVLVPEPLYLYRQRSGGITAAIMTPERLLDAIDAADQQATDLLAAGYPRAAAWAQDQAFRKRMRLVALLHDLNEHECLAWHVRQLARAAREGRELPRSTALRASRRLTAAWPRQSVRAFSLMSAARGRNGRGAPT